MARLLNLDGTELCEVQGLHILGPVGERGRSPDEIERALQLETVPEPMPAKAGPGRGHRADRGDEKTQGNGCPLFSDRTAKQLRAINRAPDAVWASLGAAARFG